MLPPESIRIYLARAGETQRPVTILDAKFFEQKLS
jgi:hypothetical protein